MICEDGHSVSEPENISALLYLTVARSISAVSLLRPCTVISICFIREHHSECLGGELQG